MFLYNDIDVYINDGIASLVTICNDISCHRLLIQYINF